MRLAEQVILCIVCLIFLGLVLFFTRERWCGRSLYSYFVDVWSHVSQLGVWITNPSWHGN